MQLTFEDGVGILRMNTGKANAISATFLEQLEAAVREAPTKCDALVLTGYDRFFSAGLALPDLLPLDRSTMRGFMERFSRVMLGVFELPIPAVACINGHAIAGGCVLALQCDYRIMARGAYRIGLSEVSLAIGLPAIVIETMRSQLSPAACYAVAQEGRLSDADGAVVLGLVHEAIDTGRLEQRSLEKAKALAALPHDAFTQIKGALRAEAVGHVRERSVPLAEQWLDLWFSEAGRREIEKAVQRLAQRS